MSGEWVLLVSLLLVAHFLGDFTPLSTPGMLRAKAGDGPVTSILAHATVHGALVGAAVSVVVPAMDVVFAAAALELVTHFAIDYLKMRLGVTHLTLQDPATNGFWHLHGADQLAHGLVLVGIAAYVL